MELVSELEEMKQPNLFQMEVIETRFLTNRHCVASNKAMVQLQDEKGSGVERGHHVKKLDIVNGPSSRHSMTSLLEQTVANKI